MSCSHIKKHRVAILTKEGVAGFGFISLIVNDRFNLVTNKDPRKEGSPPIGKLFDTPANAEHWFEEYVIASITENGWQVAWNGRPNFAQLS